MNKKVYFVCSAMLDSKLLSITIENNSIEEAKKAFYSQFGINPKITYGPFFKKRSKITDNTKIKFLGKSISGTYNEWIVNAILLAEPENSALLLFEKRIDNKKAIKPTETIIISVDDLGKIK